MELASTSGQLHPKSIAYFEKMHRAGIRVLVLYEENIFFVMEQHFSGSFHINKLLFWAITSIKRNAGTIALTLRNTPALHKSILPETSSERTLYQQFFRSVRKYKEPDDNLGEELLAICTYVLSSLPSCKKYQYLIFTEDKGAISVIEKALSRSYIQLQQYNFSAVTTTRLTQHLFHQKLLTSGKQVMEYLSSGTKEDNITFFGSGPYDLAPKKISCSISELATKITTPGAIHINY